MLSSRSGFLPLLLAVLFTTTVFAQDPPIEWGEIPDVHLAMRDFPADTNAVAVVLADYGTAEVMPDYSVTFFRHRRIKLLSEAAYDDWGTVSVSYFAGDRFQRIRKIRGQTFVVNEDGEVERHELDKKSIFKEDMDGEVERVRFTLPALEPGAVIEYRYEINTKSPVVFPEWTFQLGEPVLHSEFRTRIPDRLGFVRATRGILEFAVHESDSYLGTRGDDGTYERYVMTNVPALREEPFMTTPRDYRAAMEYQLQFVQFPNGRVEQFMSSWDKLAEELRATYRRHHKPQRDVRRQAEELVAGIDDPLARVEAIYDFVAGSVSYDGGMGIYPEKEPDEVLASATGDSPSITGLVVAMLRAVELDANPVLISTRSNGRVTDLYPLLRQFNDLVAGVRIGDQMFFLDATDPVRPYTLLPPRSLNGRGWMVAEKTHEWVGIEAGGKYRQQVSIEGTLGETGQLTGTLRAMDADYAAYSRRHALKDAEDPESFVRETVFDHLGDLTIASHTIENEGVKTEALTTVAEFSLPSYAQAAGDFMYLNPVIVGRQLENPLRLPERTFPVDLTYARDEAFTLQLKLPEGYTVQEMPRDLRMRLGTGGGYFVRGSSLLGDMLTVQFRVVLDRVVFQPNQYGELRQFFDQVVAAQAEQIVLQRVSEDASTEQDTEPGSTGGQR